MEAWPALAWPALAGNKGGQHWVTAFLAATGLLTSDHQPVTRVSDMGQ